MSKKTKRRRFVNGQERTAKALLEVLNVARLSKGALEGIGTLNEVIVDIVVSLVADLGASGNVLALSKILGKSSGSVWIFSCGLK